MAKTINGVFLRILIYGLLCAATVVAVVWKQHDIRMRRNQVIVNTVAEWEKSGKPVMVMRVERRPVVEYEKMTVQLALSRVATGFVVRELRDRLAAGQDVYALSPQGTITGHIDSVAADVDRARGMFAVRVSFDADFSSVPQMVKVFAHTRTIPDAIAVPGDAIIIAGEESYVWKIEGTRAAKAMVTVPLRTADRVIVRSGLVPGDLVVCRGQALLSSGDLVRILAAMPAEAQEKGHD